MRPMSRDGANHPLLLSANQLFTWRDCLLVAHPLEDCVA